MGARAFRGSSVVERSAVDWQLPRGISVETRGEFGEPLTRKRGQSRAKSKHTL